MTRRPLSILGLETRYVARLYLMRTLLVTVLLLTLVLALDLAGRFDRVVAAQGLVETPEGALKLAYYLLLRAEYNLPAILPIALAIGILWVEIRLTQGHERAMIANTGRARWLSLVPAVLVGLAVGLTQFTLLSHARPHAVQAQGEAGFRFYGSRFTGGQAPRSWRDFGDTILNAAIRFTPEGPVLIGVRLFVFDADNRLIEVIWADSARPEAGGLTLEGSHARWSVDAVLPGVTAAGHGADDRPDDHVALDINADWLAYAGVEARFLPNPVLTRIAAAPSGVPAQGAYRSALHERRAAVVAGIAMALLIAALSLRWLAERRGLIAPALILGAGYALQLGSNVFSALGEYERLHPALAAWGLPCAVLAGCVGIVALGHWRVARRLARLRPGG
jgi:lipopolysaccharide export LptBFGC system permease protein LptF